MNLWLVVSIICGMICIVAAIVGAVKSREDKIGIVANLSIPIFFACVVLCLATPNPPETYQKVLVVSGVVLVGIIMAESNRRHNNTMMNNVKQRFRDD